MSYLRIIKNGIASTIQDNGRFFYRELGIPVSGSFDKLSAQIANILLRNKVNTPVIEFFFSGPIIEFDADVFVSVTGANINVYIDDNLYRSGGVYFIKSGSILNLSKFKNVIFIFLAILIFPIMICEVIIFLFLNKKKIFSNKTILPFYNWSFGHQIVGFDYYSRAYYPNKVSLIFIL